MGLTLALGLYMKLSLTLTPISAIAFPPTTINSDSEILASSSHLPGPELLRDALLYSGLRDVRSTRHCYGCQPAKRHRHDVASWGPFLAYTMR
jgi:hypothetical protein